MARHREFWRVSEFLGPFATATKARIETASYPASCSPGPGFEIAEMFRILGASPDWASVYDPMRKVPRKFNKGGDSRSLVHSLDDIEPGGGAVMNLGRGRIAVWKGADGIPHAISASCTHKGCTVTWNNADRTWDCPCHGSIFAIEGSVIHGPAMEPLSPKKFPPSWLRNA